MDWNSNFLTYKVINSLEKVMPDKEPTETTLTKTVLKNERLNFQVALKSTYAGTLGGIEIRAKGGLADFVTIRKVDSVPVGFSIAENIVDDYYISNVPGLYPDILREFDAFKITLPSNQWRSVWISVYSENGLPAGKFDTTFEIYATRDENFFTDVNEKLAEFTYSLEVINETLPEIDIPVTNWIHYDCISAKHSVAPFSDEFYKVFDNYLKAYVDGGNTMLFVPLFTSPLDTLKGVERRTAQLIDIELINNEYKFDFSKLEYFIKFALGRGIKFIELSHLFTQWGGEYCPKIMAKTASGEKQIFGWHTSSHGDEYKRFISEFLPQLLKVLEKLGVKDKTFVHLTDEPRLQHLESYKQCFESVKPYIEDLPIIDALSDYEFYQKGLIDFPVPKAHAYDEIFVPNGVTGTFVYYCWYPSDKYYSNRFINMPSQRTRILGIQLYANNSSGFLHWGFNFYNSKLSVNEIDPYTVTDASGFMPSGDAFIVYPYKDGVIYSLRLELMKESFQDYRALKCLEKYIGKEKTLEIIKEWGVKGFCEYKRSAKAHIEFREKINGLIASYQKTNA